MASSHPDPATLDEQHTTNPSSINDDVGHQDVLVSRHAAADPDVASRADPVDAPAEPASTSSGPPSAEASERTSEPVESLESQSFAQELATAEKARDLEFVATWETRAGSSAPPPPATRAEASARVTSLGGSDALLEAYFILDKISIDARHDAETRKRVLRLRKRLGELLAADDRPCVADGGAALRVLVVTWNLGNAPPSAAEMEEYLPLTGERAAYDLVVFGLQECDYALATAEMVALAAAYAKARKRGVDPSGLQLVVNLLTPEASAGSQAASAPAPASPPETRALAPPEGPAPPPLERADSVRFLHHHRSSVKRRLENQAKKAVTSRAGFHFAGLAHQHLGTEFWSVVRDSQLQQMRLFAFCRAELTRFITEADHASQGTGLGTMMGNKGGVGISFKFQELRLCFASAHLAAHRRFTRQRNSDASRVLGMLSRKLGTPGSSYATNFDHVFFFGDLNYRFSRAGLDPENRDSGDLLSPMTSPRSEEEEEEAYYEDLDGPEPFSKSPLGSSRSADLKAQHDAESEKRAQFASKPDHKPEERSKVLHLIAQREWAGLMAMDQLRRERAAGRVLAHFHEADVYDFPPSFKVARGKGHVYNEKRLPAYCDRILWFNAPLASEAEQLSAWSSAEVSTSDHKPVMSVFAVNPAAAVPALPAAPSPPGFALRSLRPTLSGLGPPPAAAPVEKEGLGMQLVFRALEGHALAAMDPTGLSDPYVVLYSPHVFRKDSSALLPAARTRVRPQTIDPQWHGDLLVGRCAGTLRGLDDLKGRRVALAVFDFDSYRNDDFMGEAVLALDDLVLAMKRARGELRAEGAASASLQSGLSTDPAALAARVGRHRDALVQRAANAPFKRTRRVVAALKRAAHLKRAGKKEEDADLSFSTTAAPGEVFFDVPVVLNGKQAGRLSGLVRLAFPEDRIAGATKRNTRTARNRNTDTCCWKFIGCREMFKAKFGKDRHVLIEQQRARERPPLSHGHSELEERALETS